MDVYKGSYYQVKQQIYAEYICHDVELCSYFDATVPDLTVAEAVKLFAELRSEIDDDAVLHFMEGIARNLSNDEVVAPSTVSLLQTSTVNCLITYPEADCTSDVLAFSVPDGLSHKEVRDLFLKTISVNALKYSPDRLSRLDTIIDEMMRLHGCECYGIPIHCCGEINA